MKTFYFKAKTYILAVQATCPADKTAEKIVSLLQELQQVPGLKDVRLATTTEEETFKHHIK